MKLLDYIHGTSIGSRPSRTTVRPRQRPRPPRGGGVAAKQEEAEEEAPQGRALMPFKSAAQRRAMFAKGGKSRATAKRWAKKYGAKVGGGKTKAQKKKARRKK